MCIRLPKGMWILVAIVCGYGLGSIIDISMITHNYIPAILAAVCSGFIGADLLTYNNLYIIKFRKKNWIDYT